MSSRASTARVGSHEPPALEASRGPHAISDLALFAASFALGTAVLLTFCDIGINLSDEGVWVSAAWLFRHDVEPWVDYFQPMASALAWVYDLLFGVFGEDLRVVRGFWAVVRGLGLGLAVLGARHASPRAGWLVVVVAVALLLGGGPWHKSHIALGHGVTLWGLGALALGAGPGVALLTGFGQGLAMSADLANNVWILLPTGIVGFLLATRGNRRQVLARAAGPWLAGLAVGLAPLAAVFLPRMHAFRLQVGPATWVPFDLGWVAQGSWAGFPDLVTLLGRGVRQPAALLGGATLDLFILVAIVGLGWSVTRLVRSGPSPETIAALVPSVLAVTMLPKILIRADAPHVLQNLLPFAVVGVQLAVAAGLHLKPGRRGRVLATVALGAGLLLQGVYAATATDTYYSGSVLSLARPSVRLDLPRAGLRERPEQAAELEQLIAWLQEETDPSDTLLALPTDPLLYFLAQRRNATRLIWVAPPREGEFDLVDRSFAWEVRNRRPDWIVLRRGPLVHGDGRGLAAQAPELNRSIVQGWERRIAVGAFEIWGQRDR